jgi:hypothetical protein
MSTVMGPVMHRLLDRVMAGTDGPLRVRLNTDPSPSVSRLEAPPTGRRGPHPDRVIIDEPWPPGQRGQMAVRDDLPPSFPAAPPLPGSWARTHIREPGSVDWPHPARPMPDHPQAHLYALASKWRRWADMPLTAPLVREWLTKCADMLLNALDDSDSEQDPY